MNLLSFLIYIIFKIIILLYNICKSFEKIQLFLNLNNISSIANPIGLDYVKKRKVLVK